MLIMSHLLSQHFFLRNFAENRRALVAEFGVFWCEIDCYGLFYKPVLSLGHYIKTNLVLCNDLYLLYLPQKGTFEVSMSQIIEWAIFKYSQVRFFYC